MMSDDDNDSQMRFGDLEGLKICLIGEEKPRKNLTQESCPDRGSNPGSLRDRRACYRLFHSGGLHLAGKLFYRELRHNIQQQHIQVLVYSDRLLSKRRRRPLKVLKVLFLQSFPFLFESIYQN